MPSKSSTPFSHLICLPQPWRRNALVSIALSSMALVPATATAMEGCDWYTMIAMQQVTESQFLRCRDRGGIWSPEASAHHDWCEANGLEQANALAQRRQRAIEQCRREAPKGPQLRVGSLTKSHSNHIP